jgi:hypothetical protein
MSSFCLGCGTSLPEGHRFCGNCGRDAALPFGIAPPDPAASFGFPPETSLKAIFSLVSGVLFLFPPAAIVAVVLGHLSLLEIGRSAGRQTGKGLAITGLVLGYLGVVWIAVLVVIMAISIPKTMQAVKDAGGISNVGETTTVGAVRTLNTAEIAYAQAHPAVGYTCSLPDLEGTWGISSELAHGHKNGYTFSLHGCLASKPDGPITKYQLLAVPEGTSKKGSAYCSSESDVIKISWAGAAQDCWRNGADLPAKQINRP